MNFIRQPLFHLQALLGIAVAFGGGGVGYAFFNLVIQLAAILVLAANPDRVVRFFREAALAPKLLVVASLALPLVHLVPLPPAVWQSLPGRELVQSSFVAAELPTDLWFSFSVDKARSLVAFCGLIAPATIIIIGATLTPTDQVRLAQTFALMALATIVLGAVQLSTANSAGFLFDYVPKPDVLYGSFANRNSTALFLDLAILVIVAMPPIDRWSANPLLRSIAVVILALGVVLTQSRSGAALLGICLVFALARWAWQRKLSHSSKALGNRWALLAGGTFVLAIALVLGLSIAGGGRGSQTIDRFAAIDVSDRLGMWDDGTYAADRYWPVGSGMGTFDEVFQIDESLEYVSIRRAGRAHNDYIEIAIESGIFGLLLVALWAAWSLYAAFRRNPVHERTFLLSAMTGLGLMALQSILDYPLRNQTLLCVAALLIAILACIGRERQR